VRLVLDITDHDADAVRGIRNAIDEWLGERATELRDNVRLVVSELVTNAVQHTSGAVRAIAVEVDDAIRVEVFDQSTWLPSPMLATETDIHGRGLAILETLSDSWGCVHTVFDGRVGKVVWATFQKEG
jgi:anti-sigma regulatory factor (Ser/Thr protein kinase)